MNAFFLRGLLIASALGLAACAATPPIHYYTLVAPAKGGAVKTDAATGHGTAAPFLLEVLPIGIPAQVDQPQLVVRQGDSGILILDGERWAAPLNDELHYALSVELAQRLGTQNVAGLGHPANQAVLRVKVQIQRFDSVPGQYALIDADWSLGLMNDSGNARLRCHSSLREPVGATYADLVHGHQQALTELAAQIAVAVHRQACP